MQAKKDGGSISSCTKERGEEAHRLLFVHKVVRLEGEGGVLLWRQLRKAWLRGPYLDSNSRWVPSLGVSRTDIFVCAAFSPLSSR